MDRKRLDVNVIDQRTRTDSESLSELEDHGQLLSDEARCQAFGLRSLHGGVLASISIRMIYRLAGTSLRGQHEASLQSGSCTFPMA